MNPDQTCTVHTSTPEYAIELSFPTAYPDQQAVVAYVEALRDDFVEFAQSPPGHDRPYSLTATPESFASGDASTGTVSVVLEIGEDASPRHVTWFKAFNYDLSQRVPITLDTLFVAGTNPVEVVYVAVVHELEKRWEPEVLDSMLGEVDETTFANFALTDDAIPKGHWRSPCPDLNSRRSWLRAITYFRHYRIELHD